MKFTQNDFFSVGVFVNALLLLPHLPWYYGLAWVGYGAVIGISLSDRFKP